jgi:hypothetical protein
VRSRDTDDATNAAIFSPCSTFICIAWVARQRALACQSGRLPCLITGPPELSGRPFFSRHCTGTDGPQSARPSLGLWHAR